MRPAWARRYGRLTVRRSAITRSSASGGSGSLRDPGERAGSERVGEGNACARNARRACSAASAPSQSRAMRGAVQTIDERERADRVRLQAADRGRARARGRWHRPPSRAPGESTSLLQQEAFEAVGGGGDLTRLRGGHAGQAWIVSSRAREPSARRRPEPEKATSGWSSPAPGRRIPIRPTGGTAVSPRSAVIPRRQSASHAACARDRRAHRAPVSPAEARARSWRVRATTRRAPPRS